MKRKFEDTTESVKKLKLTPDVSHKRKCDYEQEQTNKRQKQQNEEYIQHLEHTCSQAKQTIFIIMFF